MARTLPERSRCAEGWLRPETHTQRETRERASRSVVNEAELEGASF